MTTLPPPPDPNRPDPARYPSPYPAQQQPHYPAQQPQVPAATAYPPAAAYPAGPPPGPYAPTGYPAAMPAPARPRPTSTKGPRITFFIGVGVLVVTIGLAVFAARTFWNTLPTDVLRLDGSPGSAVIGTVPVPGRAEVDVPASADYALYLVTTGNGALSLDSTTVVRAPDGESVAVGPPAFSSTVTMGSTSAELVGAFEAPTSGTYVIEAPEARDGGQYALYVTEAEGLGSFLGGVFGTVIATIAAAFLGIAALTLMIVGGIMWGVRRGNARTAGRP